MADTRTLAPVLARRAAEHPERPLVNGVTRRDSAALLSARTPARAFPRGEMPSDCPARMDTEVSVPAGRITDPDARERGIAGRRTESILRDGCQLHPREVHDQQPADPTVDDGRGDGVTPEVLGERTGADVVPSGHAGITGGQARTFARYTMPDHTIPDLDRLSDAFPMTSSGKAGRRELERMHALDSTVTSGA
jgi:hypothetical protein